MPAPVGGSRSGWRTVQSCTTWRVNANVGFVKVARVRGMVAISAGRCGRD